MILALLLIVFILIVVITLISTLGFIETAILLFLVGLILLGIYFLWKKLTGTIVS
jgi:hypothetical protein